MEKVNQFFDFEIKNKLFDIVDSNGLRPWEAVRFDVMMSVLHKPGDYVDLGKKQNVCKKIWKTVLSFIAFFVYLLRHRNTNTLFFLCSRDNNDGVQYDKIADSLYTLIPKDSCFTIESMDILNQKHNYKYGFDVAPNVANVFGLFSGVSKNIQVFYNLVLNEFPQSTITTEAMNQAYKYFVGQYYFYKMIFKLTKIKRAFLVQNDIQRGMFAAANELGVKMFELQHGQISFNHPAYSYPQESVLSSDKIYHPDYLLIFGPFWSKNRSYPGVTDLVLGNNFYAERDVMPNTAANKKLLVIANNIEGKILSERVVEVLERRPDFTFIFKLHPNQYNEYNLYVRKFERYKQVEVVSDQRSINQLLSECEGIFLNQSTVELEALHKGRKVFVIKEQRYLSMDFVLGENGVYACSDVDDFLNKYEEHKNEVLEPRNDLFAKFDTLLAKQILEGYGS